MLDLPRMNRIRLSRKPLAQQFFATTCLTPQYHLYPRVKIEFENQERLPNEPVIYAMNHTDRYNYFPFQYRLWKKHERFTATWVKGKYYETRAVGAFMEHTNNLPTVSRGYIITKDFMQTLGRKPNEQEYNAIRHVVDAEGAGRDPSPSDVEAIPTQLFKTPRDMLGVPFDPETVSYPQGVNTVFRKMMARFVELHEDVFRLGLDLLVFPQGTRSIRLLPGHIGMAEIALRYKKTVVPIGCNGSDRVHPTSSPFIKGGRVVYRFGEPIRYQDVPEFHIAEAFEPFTPEAEQKHRDKFKGFIDLVMNRVNELVDPQYQYSDSVQSDSVQGTDRFV